MHKVTVKHLLEVYKTRLEMQEQGITNPLDYIKIFTRQLLEKLSQLPQEEMIEFVDMKLIDTKGNIIADLNEKQVF